MQPCSGRSLTWLLVAVVVAVVTGAVVRLATRAEEVPGEQQGPWRDRSGTILPDGTDRGDDFALGVRVYQALGHCEWERVTFMEVAWPPGSITTLFGEARQFVRDPRGVLDHAPELGGEFTRDIELPPDAEPTGVRTDKAEIWVARRTRMMCTYGIQTAPSTYGREQSRRSFARSRHELTGRGVVEHPGVDERGVRRAVGSGGDDDGKAVHSTA
jgi:hypothetical protein